MTALLIDTPNIYAKARYKLSDLTRSDGTPSGGLYGAIRMIQSADKKFMPTRIILAFEGGGRSQRATEYADYKGDRPQGRDTFQGNHIEVLKQWAPWAGYTAAWAPSLEADDVIAHFARDIDDHVIILSSDHDFKQLLQGTPPDSDCIAICRDIAKGDLYTARDFQADNAFDPWEYRKVLAITGDASDNINGVKGVGMKKAVKLLREADWDLFRAASHPRVIEHFDVIMRNYELVGFRHPHALMANQPSPRPDRLNEMYTTWEFGSLMQRVLA